MVRFLLLSFTSLVFFSTAVANNGNICGDNESYVFRKLASDEQENICETYKGKVILIVNTASKCGYTYQYDGLEKLYEEYKSKGLVVIGFPSNDFGGQEPGTENDIQEFCRLTYGVKFPMYEKIIVKGDSASPLYKKLGQISGQKPAWNFHKYLIDRNGHLVGSYKHKIKPYDKKIINAINQHL